MDTKTVTVEYIDQARILSDVQSAADRLRRALAELRSRADRELTLLDDGFQTEGLSHQTLNEVVRYQADFDTLVRVAVYAGLASAEIQAVTSTPDFVLIRHNGERETSGRVAGR